MESYIIDFITNYGYLAVFLLIALENIFPPIPSEIVLTFAGFMTTKTSLSIFGVIIVATLGSYIGAVLLYYIGYLLKIERLEKLAKHKWVNKIGFKYENINKAINWFDKRGKITVFLCRLVPIIRSLISIPAGVTKMNFFVFSICTLIGTLIWNTILVCLGSALGNNWSIVTSYINNYAIVLVILLAVILIVWLYLKKRKCD